MVKSDPGAPTLPTRTTGTECLATSARTSPVHSGAHDTITRPWDSEKSSASGARWFGRDTVTPKAPSSPSPPTAHSASAHASPPTEQSCAERMRPAPMTASSACCSASSSPRSTRGGGPSTSLARRYRHSEPPSSSRVSPSRRISSPSDRNPQLGTLATSSIIPTMPMTGVG